MDKLLYVPGVVQVTISTYCPIGHIFFVTVQTSDGGNSLVRIDTQQKSVLDTVVVEDALLIMMWDYTASTMFVWVATETDAGVLGKLDLSTGKTAIVITKFSNLSGNGGATTLDIKTKLVYGSLLDITDGNSPVWVVIDTNTGNYTTIPTDPALGYPINFAIVQ